MPSLDLEQDLHRQGYRWVAGIDEAGRGPLAGPVVAGAVVLPTGMAEVPSWLGEVDDSKKLTARQRQRCLQELRLHAVGIGIGIAEQEEIDQVGIGDATRLALCRAVDNLLPFPDYILADYVPLLQAPVPHQALKGGDGRCYCIAAASIVAKVTRDKLMEEADKQYPGYGFARHKGYATRLHLRELAYRGPCPIHRRSFSPLRVSQKAVC